MWTGKFDLNKDTCGVEIFESGKKKVADSKISGYLWGGGGGGNNTISALT